MQQFSGIESVDGTVSDARQTDDGNPPPTSDSSLRRVLADFEAFAAGSTATSETALLSTLAMWAGARASEESRAAAVRDFGVAERPLSGFDGVPNLPEPFALSPTGASRGASRGLHAAQHHTDPLGNSNWSVSGAAVASPAGGARRWSGDSLAASGILSGRSSPGFRSRRQSSAWDLSTRLDSVDRAVSPSQMQWESAISPVGRGANATPPWYERTASVAFSTDAAAAPFSADGARDDDALLPEECTPEEGDPIDGVEASPAHPAGLGAAVFGPKLKSLQRSRSITVAASTPARSERGVVPDDLASWVEQSDAHMHTEPAALNPRNLPPRRGGAARRTSLTVPVYIPANEASHGAGDEAAAPDEAPSSQDLSLAASPRGGGIPHDFRPPRGLSLAGGPGATAPEHDTAATTGAVAATESLSFNVSYANSGAVAGVSPGAGSPLGARWTRVSTDDFAGAAPVSPGGRTPPLAPRPATLDPGSRRWSGSDLDPAASGGHGGATPTDSLRSTSIRQSLFFSGSEFDVAPATGCHRRLSGNDGPSVIGTPADGDNRWQGDDSFASRAATSMGGPEDIAALPQRARGTPSAPAIPCTRRSHPPAALPLPPALPAAHHAPVPFTSTALDSLGSPEAGAAVKEAGLSAMLLERYDDIEVRTVASAVDVDATLRFRARVRGTAERVTVFRRSVRSTGSGGDSKNVPLGSSDAASRALAEAYRFVTLSVARSQNEGVGAGPDTSGCFLMLDAFVDADPGGRAVFLYTVFQEHPRHWMPAPPATCATTPPPSSPDRDGAASPLGQSAADAPCDGRCRCFILAPASRSRDAAAPTAPVLVRIEEFAKLLWGACPTHSPTTLAPEQTALVVRWLLLSLSSALIAFHRQRLRHGAVASDVYIVSESAVIFEQACAQLREGDEEAILSLQVKLGPPALECTSRATLRHKPTTDLQDTAVTVIRAVAHGLGSLPTAPLEGQALAIGTALGSPTWRILQLLLSVATDPQSHTAVSVAAAADLAVGDARPSMELAEMQASLAQQLRIGSPGLPILGIDASGTIRYASSSSERLLGFAIVGESGRPPLHIDGLFRTGLVSIDDTWLERYAQLVGARLPEEQHAGAAPPTVAMPPFEPRGDWFHPADVGTTIVNLPTTDGRQRRVQVETLVLPDAAAFAVRAELQVDIRAVLWLRDCSMESGIETLHALAERNAIIARYIPQAVVTVDWQPGPGGDAAVTAAMSDTASRLFLPRTGPRPAVLRAKALFQSPACPALTSRHATAASSTSRASGNIGLCSTSNGRTLFPAHIASIGRHVYVSPVAFETDDMFASPADLVTAGLCFGSWLRGHEWTARIRPEVESVLPSALVGQSTCVIVNTWGLCVNILQHPSGLGVSPSGFNAVPRMGVTPPSGPSGLLLPGLELRRPVWDCFDTETCAALRQLMEAAKGAGDMATLVCAASGPVAASNRRSHFIAGYAAIPGGSGSNVALGDSSLTARQMPPAAAAAAGPSASPVMGAMRANTLPPAIPANSDEDDGSLPGAIAVDADDVSSGGEDHDDLSPPREVLRTARPSAAPLATHIDMGEVAVYVEPRISATEHLFLLSICTRAHAARVLEALSA